MKSWYLLAPLTLALSSCAGVTVGIGIGYKGITADFTIQKAPEKPKPEEPVVLPEIEVDSKAPVPVNPADDTQPQT